MANAKRRRRVWTILASLIALGFSQPSASAQTRPGGARSGGELVKGLLLTNVRVVGEGPAIVLIHGLTAAMDWWDPPPDRRGALRRRARRSR